MKLLFTICGRAGSKGYKNKNLKPFLGYPLPFYTWSIIDLYIKNHPEMDCDVVLNTDSIDLITLFQDNPISIDIIEREEELSGDSVAKTDVIKKSYEVMESRKKKSYDFVIDLDITAPLRKLHNLEDLMKKRMETDVDVVFSVTESRRNPYFNMVSKTKDGYERTITTNLVTRQSAPEVFDMNASMYAYHPSFLKSNRMIFDQKSDVILMEDTFVLDIDKESDLEMMELVAQYLFRRKPEFKEIQDNLQNLVNK